MHGPCLPAPPSPSVLAATPATRPPAPAAHLLLPPASRKAPSAEKASDVKQRPLLLFSALRRSERRRPPTMSRRPEIVPWWHGGWGREEVRRGVSRRRGGTLHMGAGQAAARSKRRLPQLPSCSSDRPPNTASSAPQQPPAGLKPSSAPAGPPRVGPKSRYGRPAWTTPAACRRGATPAPARRAAAAGGQGAAKAGRQVSGGRAGVVQGACSQPCKAPGGSLPLHTSRPPPPHLVLQRLGGALARKHVPRAHGAVPGGGREQRRTGAEGEGDDGAVVPRQHVEQAPVFEGPHTDAKGVARARHHHLARGVGRQRDELGGRGRGQRAEVAVPHQVVRAHRAVQARAEHRVAAAWRGGRGQRREGEREVGAGRWPCPLLPPRCPRHPQQRPAAAAPGGGRACPGTARR